VTEELIALAEQAAMDWQEVAKQLAEVRRAQLASQSSPALVPA